MWLLASLQQHFMLAPESRHSHSSHGSWFFGASFHSFSPFSIDLVQKGSHSAPILLGINYILEESRDACRVRNWATSCQNELDLRNLFSRCWNLGDRTKMIFQKSWLPSLETKKENPIILKNIWVGLNTNSKDCFFDITLTALGQKRK